MWIMVILVSLACGASAIEVSFSSEEACKDQIPKMRAMTVAAMPGQNPVIDCFKK